MCICSDVADLTQGCRRLLVLKLNFCFSGCLSASDFSAAHDQFINHFAQTKSFLAELIMEELKRKQQKERGHFCLDCSF